MGDYLPPPNGIIQLGAYVEIELPEADIEVLDCNVTKKDWNGLKLHIDNTKSDIVASP